MKEEARGDYAYELLRQGKAKQISSTAAASASAEDSWPSWQRQSEAKRGKAISTCAS